MKTTNLFKSKTGLTIALVWLCLTAFAQFGCQGAWGNSIDHQCYKTLGQTGYYMANDYLVGPGLVIVIVFMFPLRLLYEYVSQPTGYMIEQWMLYSSFVVSFVALYFFGYLLEKLIRYLFHTMSALSRRKQ